MGSALLSDLERASRILRTLASQVPKPVSAKIRLLPTTSETMDLLTALIERGQASAVAIHARRVGHAEIKPAQHNDLAQVLQLAKAKFPHTRFLVNGDFYTRAAWHDFSERTGADGVLLARPALYNTSIFRKPGRTTTNGCISNNNNKSIYGYNSPLLLNRSAVIQEYIKHAVRYETHYKNVKYVVAEMMNTRRTPTPVVPFLTPPQEAFLESGGQTIGLTSACHDIDSLCKLWKVNRQACRYKTHITGTTATPKTESLPATTTMVEGEHRYDDSYLLRMEQGSKKVPGESADDFPPSKRARTHGEDNKAKSADS